MLSISKSYSIYVITVTDHMTYPGSTPSLTYIVAGNLVEIVRKVQRVFHTNSKGYFYTYRYVHVHHLYTVYSMYSLMNFSNDINVANNLIIHVDVRQACS